MSNQIRVIYLLHSSVKHEGANKSFLNMIEGLITKGIIPYIIIPKKGSLCDEFDKRNINYYIIPHYISIYPTLNSFRDFIIFIPRLLRTVYVNNIALIKLLKFNKSINANFIHSNVGPIHLGSVLSKKIGIPHFWHIREYQDLDFKMKPFLSMRYFTKCLNSKNNYPIAITDGIFKYFSMSHRARVISNGVFSESSVQFNINKEKYFLFAGRIEDAKGIKELILAFIEFSKNNNRYKLLIAGDTNDRNYKRKLYDQIEQNGVKDRIVFLGMRDDLKDLMAKATALIVPSVHEAFGRITVEAMFNGCLVIGNNTGGTREILEKEKLGILYSGHDDLVSCIRKVSDLGIENYDNLIRRAQKRAIELYSNENNVHLINKFYLDIQTKPIV